MKPQNGRADRLRAILRNEPGLRSAVLAERLGDTVREITRSMSTMRQDGYAEFRDGGWWLSDKPLPVKLSPEEQRERRRIAKLEHWRRKRATQPKKRRTFASDEERREARRETNRAYRERQLAKGIKPVYKPKAIKPEKVKVKRSRIVTDAVAPKAMTMPPVDKPDPAVTEAFIRANPDRYEVIPMDAPWRTRETLAAVHRKTIMGAA